MNMLIAVALALVGATTCAGSVGCATARTPVPTRTAAASVPAFTTVVGHVAEATADDAFHLQRLEKILGRVDRSMVVHLERSGQAGPRTPSLQEGEPHDVRWEPTPPTQDDDDASPGEMLRFDACPTGRPLSGFGGVLTVRSGVGRIFLDVSRCGAQRTPTMPGFVWNTEGEDAIFVTFDGGRYRVPAAVIVPGLPEAGVDAWRHAHDSLVNERQLRWLGGRGLHDATLARASAELTAAGVSWTHCSAPLWALALREYEGNDVRVLDASAKERESREITLKYDRRVEAACGAHRERYERALLAALERREATRRKLLATMVDRFGMP